MARSFIPGIETDRLGTPLGPTGPTVRSASPRLGPCSPAALVEGHIASLLDERPVYVEFSGGCDSSLVLAAATRACRNAAHPDPIPVTYRYAGAESTEEQRYQELMVRSLGLDEWRVIDFPEGDADLLGPVATGSLRELGLLWPATLHYRAGVYRTLAGGLLLSGEGGDEVLGIRRLSWWAEALRHVLRGHHLPPKRVLSPALWSIAPRPVRRRRELGELNEHFRPDWLAPDVRSACLAGLADIVVAEPLRPSRWPASHLARPNVWIVDNNVKAFGEVYGVEIEAPLLTPSVVAELQQAIPWWEFRGRTILLRHYFADLLPVEIVERRTKAEFRSVYFGPHTRAFAEQWDGTGLPEGVDGAWLKEHWSSAAEIHGGTALLLHQAWLAANAPTGETPARSQGDPGGSVDQ